MMYRSAFAGAVLLSLVCSASDAAIPLRYDSFLVFRAKQGESVDMAVQSVAKSGFAYTDEARAVVLDPSNRRAAEVRVPLGSRRAISYQATTTGLHALCIQAGQNLARASVAGRPWAWVARREAPVHVSGTPVSLYFAPPEGLATFDLFVHARVKGEAAAVHVADPDGRTVLEREDDFDTVTRLRIKCPKPTTGRAWRIDIHDPGKPDFALDDVSIWLGRGLQPLVCPKPEWLGAFKGVTGAPPEKIGRRVFVHEGVLRLTRAAPCEVRFQLPTVAKAKLVAIRMRATDVDYRIEAPVVLNGVRFFLPTTGDGITADVTVKLAPRALKVGENVIQLTQDPSGGSRTYSVARIELLFGEAINFE